MARRATSPSTKQATAKTTSTAKLSEPVAAEMPRRRGKAKPVMPEQAESSLTDTFFPGGEEPADAGAEVGATLPVKARRGRKPKAQPDEQAVASVAADNGVQGESAPLEFASNGDGEPADIETDSGASPSASPRKTRRRRNIQGEGQPEASMDTAAASPPMQQAAVRRDANTETATFDWPSIEQVAARDGPNQTMAKLLLAARAEGANSRWPF